MNGTISVNGRYESSDLLVGMLDALMAFGVALSARGVLTREEIAAAMAETGAQQRRDDGDGRAGRKVAADFLRQVFSAPVVGDRRFTLVGGGKPEAQE